VYGDGEAAEGQRYPLSTIKEIIRTEEQEPENKGKGKRGRKSKSSKSKKRKEDSDEEDEDMDEWEMKGGILHGIVPKWDPIAGTTEEEVTGKSQPGVNALFRQSLTSPYHRYYCLCPLWHRNKGRQGIFVQICQITQLLLHWIGCP
jgi:hypothetical protein